MSDYYKNGGIEGLEIKKFYILNDYDNQAQISDIKIHLKDSKGNTLATVLRGENLTWSPDGSNQGAAFNVPWEDDYELWLLIKWKGDEHYKPFNTKIDDDNVPFKFTEHKNGLIVWRDTTLKLAPLYSCYS